MTPSTQIETFRNDIEISCAKICSLTRLWPQHPQKPLSWCEFLGPICVCPFTSQVRASTITAVIELPLKVFVTLPRRVPSALCWPARLKRVLCDQTDRSCFDMRHEIHCAFVFVDSQSCLSANTFVTTEDLWYGCMWSELPLEQRMWRRYYNNCTDQNLPPLSPHSHLSFP